MTASLETLDMAARSRSRAGSAPIFLGASAPPPISEAAIAGVFAGLALAGFRPIAEIIFGDFLTLCFDQIVNHIANYGAMYDGAATCPVVIRTPSAGRSGLRPHPTARASKSTSSASRTRAWSRGRCGMTPGGAVRGLPGG